MEIVLASILKEMNVKFKHGHISRSTGSARYDIGYFESHQGAFDMFELLPLNKVKNQNCNGFSV